ncbi:MAG TPA: protein-methionine-sulfoxide reductase heme-binding subunit MsrQ [Candidatus Dormibacteraeota bacterium]|nr:protein-methionine-sulfoxide reductase heme-binding subunit MsrQ [Candidatus Dormibacteraeota bacterium]
MRKILTSKWTKVAVFVVSSIPFALLCAGLLRGDLGINPVETLQHTTGDWTLRFLIFTLAITPLRKTFKLPELIRFRRMLGLFAFFYVFLHFLTYLGPDQSFNFSGMWDDVAKRKFVTVGFAAFVLMIPLAATSTAEMIRRLGGKRWQALHRLIYMSAILGVIHYYWLVKSDVRKPLIYAFFVGILLLWRVWDTYFRGKGKAPVPARSGVSTTG